MITDLLNTDNFMTFNIKLAQTIGLRTAIYCSVLAFIYQKAKTKNKLIDGDFFKVDRKYIFNRTTLNLEDQAQIDINLIKMDIMEKNKDNLDIVRVDFDIIASIMANDDLNLLDDLSTRLKLNNKLTKKQTQKQIIINRLKDSIVCQDYDILTALRDWVDCCVAQMGKVISKKTIELFQTKITEYSGGDKNLMLSLITLASAKGYTDATWAISLYNKNNSMVANTPRYNQQKQLNNEEDLSDITF